MNEENINIFLNEILDRKIDEKLNIMQKQIDEKFNNITDIANMKFDFIDKRIDSCTSNTNANNSHNLKSRLSFKTLLFLNK